MKKRTLSRLLAAFLAVMLLAQSLCLTAFAEETTLEATPEAVTETEPVNETVINEPEVEEPVVEEPVVEEPVVEEPVVEKPVAEEPVVEGPVAEESVAEEPMAEEPMAEEPMAEEPEVKSEATQVLIPAGSDAATVNSILTKALLGKDANPDTTWEYECIGYYTQHITNKAWGPIEGFKSETRKLGIKTTYTHAALANNEDGIYDVRVTGTTNTFTIHKLAKLQSSIALKQDISLPMCYGQDGTPDIAATKEAIFAAVVESSTPELALSDVTMVYYATATTGTAMGIGQAWVPLEGGKGDELFPLTYPAIGLGQQKIRISWGGSEEYGGFSAETTITLTERPAPEYTLKESPSIKLTYNDDLTVNYADIESAVFDAIVDTAPFTASDVSIEYYAEASTGSVGSMGKEWVPLKGGKVNVLTYPAISEGTWSIHIIYPGSQTLAPVTIEQDLEVCGREPMQFNLKEGPYTVGMVFNEQQGYDFAATAKAIYEAVVESTVPTLNFEDVKVEFNASPSDKIPSYRPLDYAFAGQNLFGEGTWSIRISWGGSKEYAPGDTVVSVTTTDNRIASQITLKSDASFTYNMDVTAMKQAVLDNVIDWNASTLPAKDTLSLEDFTFEYKASPSILDDVNSDKLSKEYVPFEGGKIIISYPQIGAGVQSIRVTYKGSAEYKPSQPTEGSITVNKAKVKVHVKSASMYVSEAKNGLNLVTTTPDDHFNTFVVYAGVTRNVTTAVYLQLPESYTSNKVLIKLLDKALESLGQPTFTEMLQNGITLGQLRQLLKTKEIVDILEKIGIDTGALGQLIEVIDKLPAVGDDLCIAVGVPNRAGAYSVTAITDNKNYNVGVGVGALVLKADKAKLVWKQDIGKKISAANAKTADFAAELQMNGEAVSDQSSVHVLYSGLTSKWKAYSSTTTAPTEPGRYVMTVVVLGGNYQAAPITRSFQITK